MTTTTEPLISTTAAGEVFFGGTVAATADIGRAVPGRAADRTAPRRSRPADRTTRPRGRPADPKGRSRNRAAADTTAGWREHPRNKAADPKGRSRTQAADTTADRKDLPRGKPPGRKEHPRNRAAPA